MCWLPVVAQPSQKACQSPGFLQGSSVPLLVKPSDHLHKTLSSSYFLQWINHHSCCSNAYKRSTLFYLRVRRFIVRSMQHGSAYLL